MPPESEDYLSIARRDLGDATTIPDAGIARVAAPIWPKRLTHVSPSCRYKREGDYGMGEADVVTIEAARTAIERAPLFIDAIEALLVRQ